MLDTQHTDLWCKICGITNVADALVAVDAGADAIGLNCYPPSPRFIDVSLLAEISDAVSCTRVALFVDADARQVERVLAAADIDLLQFQGEEDPAFCAQFGVPYVKGLRVRPGLDIAEQHRAHADAWALLLDAYVAGLPGGTGARMDLGLWPKLPDRRLILAGGLSAANVAAAVRRVHPFGVDVCGGVESDQKGIKDQQKIRQFMMEVRRV